MLEMIRVEDPRKHAKSRIDYSSLQKHCRCRCIYWSPHMKHRVRPHVSIGSWSSPPQSQGCPRLSVREQRVTTERISSSLGTRVLGYKFKKANSKVIGMLGSRSVDQLYTYSLAVGLEMLIRECSRLILCGVMIIDLYVA